MKDVADVTVELPQENRESGERGVQFLPTCGAAQEKQSAAALPSLTPPALPGFFVWGVSGRWPQRAPSQELAFRHHTCTVRCTVRDGAFDEHTAGRFVLERALLATLTHVLAVFLAGSEGVYKAATYTVFLSPCSSRFLHAFSSIWSIFPLRLCVIFHVSARATSPFLLLDTHVSFIIRPAFTTILSTGSSITSVSAWARSCPRVPGCSSSS